MKRVRTLGVAATVASVAALLAAVAATAAPGDNSLGGPPLPDTASTICSDSAFARGVSGFLGEIGPNDIVGAVRMECLGGASPIGQMGTDPDNPRDSICPDGKVAVGIEGSEGDFIDRLAVRCQDDDLSGPIVADGGFGGAGGQFDGPYDCPTDQALVGFTGTVTEDLTTVRNVVLQCAERADTTTTLEVKTPRKKVKASGSVKPDQTGEKVTVTLSEKKGGRYVKVDQKKPTLGEDSLYETSFDKPDAKDCKVKVKWPGDVDSEPSSASEKFGC